MDKDTLIVNQALEIATLKERVEDIESRLRQIKIIGICIGGPLNDNKLGYTRPQLEPFFRINQLAAE